MSHLQVSVVIPVYNAADFIRQAVESALIQPQTAEVVLVEDCSTDNSWEICQQIAAENDRVRLFRHADGGNHGEGASRSLAVQKSSGEYVAFLDADDFFLTGRFDTAEQIFASDAQLDGVYEAIGFYVENEDSFQRWKDSGHEVGHLTTMTKRVLPEDLFFALVNGKAGSFSVDGLVVKRSIFEKTGYFDSNLILHTDVAFMIRAAALTRLAPGKLDEAVTMRRVHSHNSLSAPRPNRVTYKMRLTFWTTLLDWCRQHLDREKQQLILQAMFKDAARRPRFDRQFPARLSGFRKVVQLSILPFEYPFVLKERTFWRACVQAFPTKKKTIPRSNGKQ
jgi:glycosyltransferase involved in cell wall biosynthesis